MVLPAGLCVLLTVAGCVSAPPPQGSPTLREANRMEAAATPQRAIAAPGQALGDLERAARLYALMDDTAGVVRVYLTIARLQEQHGEIAVAARYANMALQLSEETGDVETRFRALLMAGRLQADADRFAQALAVAPGKLEKAVALTYLQRHVEAYDLISGLAEPQPDQLGDLAFVLHGHAQSVRSRDSAERALTLYRLADNYHGIGRCLRLLGDIAAQDGAEAVAVRYRARAARVEAAIAGAMPGVTQSSDRQ